MIQSTIKEISRTGDMTSLANRDPQPWNMYADGVRNSKILI